MSPPAAQETCPSLGAKSVLQIRLGYEPNWNYSAFWEHSRPWLVSRGYKLYQLEMPTSNPEAWLPSGVYSSASLPYVDHHWPTKVLPDSSRMEMIITTTLICSGQDSQQREIIVKLTDRGTEEYAIYKYLWRIPELHDPATFPGVLPPVDILDSPDGFAYVVFPRWNDQPFSPEVKTAAEVMYCIRSLLQGLTSLHQHRLAHRDISDDNFLLDYPLNAEWTSSTATRKRRHRASPDVHYCLFDYDLSRLYPRDSPLRQRFVPSSEAYDLGKPWLHPNDFAQGEPIYNPFGFDVGCMGNTLKARFWHCVPVVPILVPLLDHMTTDDISRRFTAAEAYHFIDETISNMSEVELSAEVPEEVLGKMPSLEDLWKSLPQEFILQWRAYRSPPLSWSTRILRFISTRFTYNYNPLGFRFLAFVRRILGR